MSSTPITADPNTPRVPSAPCAVFTAIADLLPRPTQDFGPAIWRRRPRPDFEILETRIGLSRDGQPIGAWLARNLRAQPTGSRFVVECGTPDGNRTFSWDGFGWEREAEARACYAAIDLAAVTVGARGR